MLNKLRIKCVKTIKNVYPKPHVKGFPFGQDFD